jgi:hypothetical protein
VRSIELLNGARPPFGAGREAAIWIAHFATRNRNSTAEPLANAVFPSGTEFAWEYFEISLHPPTCHAYLFKCFSALMRNSRCKRGWGICCGEAGNLSTQPPQPSSVMNWHLEAMAYHREELFDPQKIQDMARFAVFAVAPVFLRS